MGVWRYLGLRDGGPRFISHLLIHLFISNSKIRIMKKILFIFILVFMLVHNKVYSQTLSETFRWINATFVEMMIDNEDAFMLFKISCIYRDTLTKKITDFDIELTIKSPKDTVFMTVTIPFSEVIVYETKKGNDIAIGFSPKTGVFNGIVIRNNEAGVVEYNGWKPFYANFEDTPTNRDKVKRLVKAFHHFIELTGNKVHNKDIF